MIRKYILRLFITATIILSNNLYAQEDEITNDIKEHCTSFIINYKDINNSHGIWSENENLCTVSFNNGNGTIVHYVGSWSINGPKGYGQGYSFSSEDGRFISSYKGLWRNFQYEGFGHLIVNSRNPDGELITKSMMGVFEEDRLNGLTYLEIYNHHKKLSSVSYGMRNNHVIDGVSIVFTDKLATKVVWEKGKFIDVRESLLLSDQNNYKSVQNKYFDKHLDYFEDKNIEIYNISAIRK